MFNGWSEPSYATNLLMFYNSDLREVSGEFGRTFENVSAVLFPGRDLNELIHEVYDFADAHDIDFTAAYLVLATQNGGDIGPAVDLVLTKPVIETFGLDMTIECPDELRDFVECDVDPTNDELAKNYDVRVIQLVADLDPDSKCAQVLDNLYKLADMKDERIEAFEEYQKAMDEFSETGRGDVSAAMNHYNQVCADQQPDREAIYADDRVVLSDIHAVVQQDFARANPYLYEVAQATVREYMGQEFKVENVDTSIDKSFETASTRNYFLNARESKAEFDEAREAYRTDPSEENRDRFVDAYIKFNDCVEYLRTIPTRDFNEKELDKIEKLETAQDAPVQATKDSAENHELDNAVAKDDAVDNQEGQVEKDQTDESDKSTKDSSEQPERKLSFMEQLAANMRKSTGVHTYSKEAQIEEAARPNMGKKPWYIFEDANGERRGDPIEAPFSARSDAHVVMDYAVSRSVFAHNTDFPVFAGGMELEGSIISAMDYIEKGVKDGWPLCTELDSVIKSLDELGPRNGDVEHDNKVQELEDKRHDIYLRAGATIAGYQNSDWRDQADAVLNYHHIDKACDPTRQDPDRFWPEDVGMARQELEVFNDEGVAGSPYRSGPAIEYCRYLDIRDDAEKRLPELEKKLSFEFLNPNATRESMRDIDTRTFDAQFDSQNSQRMMERIVAELEYCKEGIEVYGPIQTPDEVEKPEMIDGGDEPTFLTRKEIEDEPVTSKSEYETAKEQYEGVRDLYTFRNVFVSMDRLKFDIEAYKVGENGANGKPVSGGVIAMDVLEVMRGNLGQSIMEVGLRAYFDQKYPPVDKPEPVDMLNEDPTNKLLIRIEKPDGFGQQVEFSMRYYDNGYVDKDHRDGTRPDTANPAFGRFYGVDMTRPPIINDIELEVRPCGPKTAGTMTYEGKDGVMETLRIPSIRLVEIKDEGRFYMIDPFGRTLNTNVTISSNDRVISGDVEQPYFRTLDISATQSGAEAIEKCAAHKGIPVEAMKERISNQVMDSFIERTLEHIDRHQPYLTEKLIPRAESQLEAVTERLDYLREARDYVSEHVSTPNSYEDEKRKESYEKLLGHLESSVGKLEILQTGLADRLDKMWETVTVYSEAKEIITADMKEHPNRVDMLPRFAYAAGAEKFSYGKIDNPYYGLNKMDLISMDKLCSACAFKGRTSDTSLEHEFVGVDWPKGSNVSLDKNGAKSTFDDAQAPDTGRDANMVAIWRERLQYFIPNVEYKNPGLYQEDDLDKFHIPEFGFNIAHALHDLGMLETTLEERLDMAEENRRGRDPNDWDAETRYLSMEKHVEPRVTIFAEEDAYKRTLGMDSLPDRPRDAIPTEKEIEEVRSQIRDFGDISDHSTNFGCREKSPDLDWSTVSGKEVLRDSDGKHFWMRIEGQGPDFIRVTPIQASGVMKGPIDQIDIREAITKYLGCAAKPDSTYNFATDFFEDNKYRIDPESAITALAGELDRYFHYLAGESGGVLPKDRIDLVADCLISVKDTIVNHFAEKVADKVEALVEKNINDGDVDRVNAFVNMLEYRMGPAIEHVAASDFSREDHKQTAEVAHALERIGNADINPRDFERLANIVDVMEKVFDGYTETMKDLVMTIDRDAEDAVTRDERDSDAVVAAGGAEEDGDGVDRDEDEGDRVEGRDADYVDHEERDDSDGPSKTVAEREVNDARAERKEDDDRDIDDDRDVDEEDDDDIWNHGVEEGEVYVSGGELEKFLDAADSFHSIMESVWTVEGFDGDKEADLDWADGREQPEPYNDDAMWDAMIASPDDDMADDNVDGSVGINESSPDHVYADNAAGDGLDHADVEAADTEQPMEAQTGVEVEPVEDGAMNYADVRNYNDDAADEGDADIFYDSADDNGSPADVVNNGSSGQDDTSDSREGTSSNDVHDSDEADAGIENQPQFDDSDDDYNDFDASGGEQ